MLHLDFLALGWGFGLITALYTQNQYASNHINYDNDDDFGV